MIEAKLIELLIELQQKLGEIQRTIDILKIEDVDR